MIGYRDMTFCTANKCVKFYQCPRALTEEVKAAARKWWGGDGAPITQFMEPEKLDCYRPSNEQNTQTR